MSIRHAILGFLSWQPSTGYELKKRFAEATPFHWSGNNNQVYGALIELHREGLVQVEVVQQEKRPARKVYAITERGREALEGWLREGSEPPETRADFHARLAWSALVLVLDDGRSLALAAGGPGRARAFRADGEALAAHLGLPFVDACEGSGGCVDEASGGEAEE